MCEAPPPMLHSFAPWLPSVSQHFLVVAIALLVYVLTTRARREQRAPTSAIAWVLGMLLTWLALLTSAVALIAFAVI